MINEDHAVFTVCNLAYLPKALVLANSLLKHGQPKLKIYLIDRKCDVALPEDLADFVWIEDVGMPDLHELAFKYDITEFSTSVKPFLAANLLKNHAKVIFLDPDTCVYAPLTPILDDLDRHPIVLTPHYTTPMPDAWPDADIGMMRFGSFNLGFFAVNGADEALAFLAWWDDRCRRFCFFETQFGLSTDQKWVSIAPCFFKNLHVSFHVGYNVAHWNVFERSVSVDADGKFWVNGVDPLIFFHFSSFDAGRPHLLSKRPFLGKGEDRPDLSQLHVFYAEELKKCEASFPKKAYAFDYMSDGSYISPTLRRAYVSVLQDLPLGHDPFDSNGPVGRFARKNFLLERGGGFYEPSGYDDVASHRRKFAFVNACMRLLLRLMGANRFANFSRLLVYLSSYRQNRAMWKL